MSFTRAIVVITVVKNRCTKPIVICGTRSQRSDRAEKTGNRAFGTPSSVGGRGGQRTKKVT